MWKSRLAGHEGIYPARGMELELDKADDDAFRLKECLNEWMNGWMDEWMNG